MATNVEILGARTGNMRTPGCRGCIPCAAVVLCLSVVLGACDSAAPEPSASNPLGLEWLPALRKAGVASVAGAVQPDVDMQVDLGDLPVTRDYYFVVTNSADRAIRHVRVELVAGDAFSVAPDFLDTVPADRDARMPPIIRVSVVHGVDPSSLQAVPVLEKGDHAMELRLSGILPHLDTDGGSDRAEVVHGLRVKRDVVLTLNAMLTDVTFYDDQGVVGESRRSGNIASVQAGVPSGFVPAYRRYGDMFTVNTGSVDVPVEFLPNDGRGTAREELLAPGDTLVLFEPEVGWLRVGPGDAVRDNNRLPVFPDGSSYFYFNNRSF